MAGYSSSILIATSIMMMSASGVLGFEIPEDKRDRLPFVLPTKFPDIFPDFPTLPPNWFENLTISPRCGEDLARMFDDGRSQEATLALDACGKPQPGFLAGNLAWLGHYPECKALDDYHFCTAFLRLNITFGVFPTMRWGLCLPSDCDESDVANSLQDIIDMLDYEELQSVNPRVTSVLCASDPPRPLDVGFYATVSLCCVAALLALLGALVENRLRHRKKAQETSAAAATAAVDETSSETLPLLHHSHKHNGITRTLSPSETAQKDRPERLHHKLLLCFSLTRNMREILKTDAKEGNMLCLNGIRVISMTWVILGHTIMLLYTQQSFSWDGIYALDTISSFAMQAIVNAFPAVDTFFFLSGLLLVYISLGRMARSGGKLPWGLFYFHRYWRLLPSLCFTMLFALYLVPYFGEGPVWAVHARDDFNCHTYWWTNLLYINNFYPKTVTHGCVYWVWYLANDMQFYAISPIILIALHRKPKLGILMLVTLCIASMAATMALMFVYEFDVAAMGVLGSPVGGKDIVSTIYVKPYCRIIPYLFGMALGYAFHRWRGRRIRINKILALFGWAAAIASGMAVVYGLYGAFNGRPLTTAENAVYMAFSRLGWAGALAWVVFACFYGYGGWVNDFLSWRAWLPLCRLTFCAYLFHPMVVQILAGNTAHAFSINTVFFSYYFVGSCVFSYLVSLLVALAFELPMANLEGVLRK